MVELNPFIAITDGRRPFFNTSINTCKDKIHHRRIFQTEGTLRHKAQWLKQKAAATTQCLPFYKVVIRLTNSRRGATTASVVRGCSLRRINDESFFILATVSFSENLGDAGSGEKLMIYPLLM